MKAKLITGVKYLWVAAIVTFVIRYFYTHSDEIISIVHILPWLNLLMAFGSLFMAKVLLSYVSLLSVQYVGVQLTFSKMFAIYNITQLAKYIPGSIWQFVGKAGAYAKEGINTGSIKKSMLIEMLWVLSSALFFGLILFTVGDVFGFEFLIKKIKEYFFIYLILFSVVGAGALVLYKKTTALIAIFLQNNRLNMKMLLVLMPVWFLLGTSFFVTIVPYIEKIDFFLYINIVGLYALAYFIGFLMPFAPAGIGIREAILVAGLSTLVSNEQAIVLASLNRIIYIVLEVIIVLSVLQFRFYKHRYFKSV